MTSRFPELEDVPTAPVPIAPVPTAHLLAVNHGKVDPTGGFHQQLSHEQLTVALPALDFAQWRDATHPRLAAAYTPSQVPAKPGAGAPRSLRVTVVVLAALLVAAIAGLLAARIHPSFFSSLRDVVSPDRAALVAGHSGSVGRFSMLSSSANGAVYSVPTSTYAIVISIAQPVWARIESPANSAATRFEATMTPDSTPKSVTVHGSSSVEIAARTRSIAIEDGHKILGIITSPVVGFTYTFQPSKLDHAHPGDA